MTMMVCFELGKTEDEIAHWTVQDVYRWCAFLRLKSKAEADAIKRNTPSAPSKGQDNTVTIFE